MTLTRAQKRIIEEVNELNDYLGFDPQARVEEWEGSEFLTTMLELTRREQIVAAIVHEYTFVDELLGTIIARYFFDFGKGNYRQLWRTKKFQRFNFFILEKLYLVQKLDLVRSIRPLPNDVDSFVGRLNNLRNAVAHSFFPENLRGARTQYKGTDIFSIEGFRKFAEDRDAAVELLYPRAFG